MNSPTSSPKRPDPAALAALAAGSSISPSTPVDPVLISTGQAPQTSPPRQKWTLRVPPDLPGRLRAAWVAELNRGSQLSFAEFVEQALQAAVTQAERKHNNGQEFEPIGPGIIPTGRAAQ